jgi:monothiol glutaredoxin
MLKAFSAKEHSMSRLLLDESKVHPAIRQAIDTYHQTIVREVQSAIGVHHVVVVGMRGNPFVRKARGALEAAGAAHHYLEYGSYLGMWRERNALKMWTGWPTLPMVFVRGILVGGATDLQKLIGSGEFASMLKS